MSEITIRNVTKIGTSQYRVDFDSENALEDLFYETSSNGSTWSTPIECVGFTSPQTIECIIENNFYIRLSSTVIRVHNDAYNEAYN